MNRNESLARDILEAGNEHFQIAAHPKRVLFWTADADGGCEVVSANWTEYTGQPVEDAHDSGWMKIIDPIDRAHVTDAVRLAIDAQRGFYLHYRILSSDGTVRRVLHDASARYLPSGKFNGLVGTLTDDTAGAAGEQFHENSTRKIYQFLDSISLTAIAIDPRGRLAHINRPMARVLNHEPAELIGCDWIGSFIAVDDRVRVERLFSGEMPLSTIPSEFEYQVDTPIGRRLFRWHLTLIRDGAGTPLSVAMMGTDITQWRRLGNQQRLTAKVFDNSTEAMVITDQHNQIISINRAFTRLTGYSESEALGQNPRVLQSGKHGAAFYQDMWRSILERGYWRGDIWDRRKDGTYYPKFLAITALRDESDAITHFSAIFYDVSERKQLEEKLESLAHFDPLTGLPNRMLLQDRLEHTILTSERLGQCFALLFIDLDGFKQVNDGFGHPFGDELLKLVGQRLGAATRGMDTAARFGGDEFVVLLTDIKTVENATGVANKIIDELSAPYLIAGESAMISASVGISIYPNDERAALQLLRTADEAMYQAKREGKQRVVVYGGIR